MYNSLPSFSLSRSIFNWIVFITLSLLPVFIASGAPYGPQAAPQTAWVFLKEELPTYAAGPDQRIALKKNEHAGEFFTAPAAFDTISFQVLQSQLFSAVDLGFAIYGPFPEDELPVDYAMRLIGNHKYLTFTDKDWLQARFPPQRAGNYYWEIRNVNSNAPVGCYARGGRNAVGHAIIRNELTFWLDLKSTIAYLGPDLPLKFAPPVLIPEATPDPRTRGFGSLFSIGQRIPGTWLNDAAKLPGAGWRSLVIPHTTKPEFWPTVAALQRGRTYQQLIVALPFWTRNTLSDLTSGRPRLRGGLGPTSGPRLEDLWDPGFLENSRAAMTGVLKSADEAGVAGAFQLLGPLFFNFSYSVHAKKAWAEFIQSFFGDEQPHTDDNGDGVTFNGLFDQKADNWPAIIPFDRATVESNPQAAKLTELFFDRALANWVETVADANNSTRPLYVATGDLNQLAQMPPGIGLALENPTPHQLDILARLARHDRPGIYALRPHPTENSPQRLDALRWLICRNLDSSLGFILDELDAAPVNPRPYYRQPSVGLVNGRLNTQTGKMNDPNGSIVRLKRAARALSELGPFMQSPPAPSPSILVIASDLDQAPFIDSAAYVSEASFLEQPSIDLDGYDAVIVSAAGKASLGGSLLKRLEQFVKKGGQVLVSPEQFQSPASILPLSFPDKRADRLTLKEPAENEDYESIYLNTFSTTKEWLKDSSLEEYSTGPITLLANFAPDKVTTIKNGKMHALPRTARAELKYKIRLPHDAQFAKFRVRYESWRPGDWVRIWWSDEFGQLTKHDFELPQTRGRLNEFTRIIDIKRDLPHEILYLIVLVYSGSPTSESGEIHGAALDEMEVSITRDPLINARRAELDGISVMHMGDRQLFAEPRSGFKALGKVTVSGGENYPLALVSRKGWLRGGNWIYVNCPELLTESGPETTELMHALLARVLKKHSSPPLAYRITQGSDFIALTKNDHEEQLEKVAVEATAENGPHVVYDYFADTVVEHAQAGETIKFTTDLLGPYAAKLFLIKSAKIPILLKADGQPPNAAKISNAGESELTFAFAQEACIYSPRPPQAVTANNLVLSFEYDESTKILRVFGDGELKTAKVVY